MADHAEHPPSNQPIALDAMGGDLGVSPLIDGAVAAAFDDGAAVIVVGDASADAALTDAVRARGALTGAAGGLRARAENGGHVEFVFADDVVTMEDKPQQAVKKKKSSMRKACDLVEEGRARAVVSVANSGAMVATSSFVFGRFDGVARPCIATVLPSFAPSASGRFGRSLLVDAGANNVCTPLHLAQFGVMGSVYLEKAFGTPRPAVAVLSNGEEEHKGTPLSREALALLKQTDVNVVGFCEGRDLTAGVVHVVVTDGFTGNIVLKTSEGVFSFLSRVIKETFEGGSLVDNLGGLLSKPGWARIKREIDPREFGAAPLLGLARPSFIAHGKSDAHAVRCAIRAARRYVDHDVGDAISAAVVRNASVWRENG